MVPPPLAVRGDDGEKDDYDYLRKSPDHDGDSEGYPTSIQDFDPHVIQTTSGYLTKLPHYPFSPTITSWSIELSLSTQSQNSALPDITEFSSSGPVSTSSNESPWASATDSDGYIHYPPHNPHSKHGPPIVPMAVVPTVVLAIIGALVFFCLRKRKKQLSRAQDQEMKERRPIAQPYVAPPALSPAASLPQPLSQPSFSSAAPTAPAPVILGPITASNNYFTGIDTSDIMSVRSDERTGLGNPFADDHNLDDEPPPPYYPASVPPLSRESSVRIESPPRSVSSQTELIDARPTPVRSPFEDPGDDAVSEISTHDARRDGDAMSAVSDLSYQDESVARRGVL